MNLQNPHIQTTAKIWPNSPELKEYLSIPLALSIQPFANQQPEGSIPVDRINQYRCQSCKSFINQLCFIRNDHEYDCSICGCTNYLEKQIDFRMPELNNLSFKIKAPQQQRQLSTSERLFAFVLDLSNYGQESREYLMYALHVVKEFARMVQNNAIKIKIMIVGFDCGVIRYVINPQNKGKVRKIVTNIEEQEDQQYFPQTEQLMAGVLESFQNIEFVLKDIQKMVIEDRLRQGHSKAIMQALKLAFTASEGYSGKIFLVSGLRAELSHFYNNLKRFFLDVYQRHSYLVNKKQCISAQLQSLLKSTQMSLWISFINNSYMNNMPFHCITKIINGELRHYYPYQLKLFFHEMREAVEQIVDEATGFQALMRVRYSTGLKMVGVFGTVRPTRIQDQVELLTCPSNRRLMFEFILDSRIFTDFVVVQFSTLYTSFSGDRYFVIETHMNKVSANCQYILSSIDYANINVSYVRGIVHNLDMSSRLRNLQIILQERCKKHIKAIRQSVKTLEQINQGNMFESEWIRKAKPYIVLTFLMMKHFLLNQAYPSQMSFDLNVDMRSKVATLEDSVNIIWPIVYAIKQDGWDLIEMKEANLPKATVAIFIDRGDQHYVYLSDPSLQGQLRTANGKQILESLIANEEHLKQVRLFIKDFKERKGLRYLDVIPLQEIGELKILDMEGQFGFDKFINQLLSN